MTDALSIYFAGLAAVMFVQGVAWGYGSPPETEVECWQAIGFAATWPILTVVIFGMLLGVWAGALRDAARRLMRSSGA